MIDCHNLNVWGMYARLVQHVPVHDQPPASWAAVLVRREVTVPSPGNTKEPRVTVDLGLRCQSRYVIAPMLDIKSMCIQYALRQGCPRPPVVRLNV